MCSVAKPNNYDFTTSGLLIVHALFFSTYVRLRTMLEDKFKDIIQHTDMPKGGHFAALEEPRLLADDIISFVKKLKQIPKHDDK